MALLALSLAMAQAAPPPPKPVPAVPADPHATVAARSLLSRLAADYGKRSWSALKLTNDIGQIFTNTARTPAIISGDFMDYSPSRVANGSNPKAHVEKMMALHQEGFVNAMDWHWGAPTNSPSALAGSAAGSFMTKTAGFDLAAALGNTNSPEYALLVRDLDAIAMELRKFADANIPVLWRPLHEADGKWFWWGAKGAGPCKELWRLIFTRFTGRFGLHNLIWVYTPANPTRDEWYPGDDVVDIVGLDAYPKDPADTLAAKWQELQARYDGRKLLALTEFGGVPDIEAMQAAGVWWSYFSSWNRTLHKSPRETLVRTYGSPRVVTLESVQPAPAREAGAVQNNIRWVNMVQDAAGIYHSGAHRSALMRYPCGRIGLWSIDQGEIADAVSRGLRIYPCIGTITNKDNLDWRDSIAGDPSLMRVKFRADSPACGSAVELTVTPHVSCYRYRLPDGVGDKALVMTTVDVPALMSWNSKVLKWTNNTFRVVDDRTVEMTVSGFKKATIYYYIRFSMPCAGKGVIDGMNIRDGVASTTGDRIGGYLKFGGTEVIAAVAVSHTSMAQARAYMTAEFGDLAFDAAAVRLKRAWVEKLGKVEAAGPELRLRQLYTALYTVYVNVIDVTDNPYYTGYRPLLSIASSDYWQYVGGYMRCSWDMSRGVYSLVSLLDPELFTHILNTYQAQYDRDGKLVRNWDPFVDQKSGDHNYAPNIALLGRLQGVDGVDYTKFKDAAQTTVQSQYETNFFTLGYIPALKPNGSTNRDAASRILEYCPQVQALANLARTLGDTQTYDRFYNYRTNYQRLYDAEHKRFRARFVDGSWAPVDMKAVFFEGSGADYVFAVPHDPYGILRLYGPESAVTAIDEYVGRKSDFNDYKLIYEFLPIFADRADVAQRLVREAHVGKFESLTMAEGLWGGPKGCYYTDNAGPLASAILGLYWIPTSGATWMITTPSVDRYVIHGKTDVSVETVNPAPANHYLRSVRVNGEAFPSFLISGKRLVAGDQKIALELAATPFRLGELYLSSTDGEVLDARGDGRGRLEFEIDPVAASCVAQVYSATRPVSIRRDGVEFANWEYDAASKLVRVVSATRGRYRVVAGN